jgi:hypothetical protein
MSVNRFSAALGSISFIAREDLSNTRRGHKHLEASTLEQLVLCRTASFLQSSVQEINLQTTLSGGIGRYSKNTNRSSD